MIVYAEPAEYYHARKAVSAGMIWTWIDECPYQAWYESPFNPQQPVETKAHYFDIGNALHLAVLESPTFAEKCSLIPAKDYKTKEARDIRDACYIDGKIPLLWTEYELCKKMRKVLEQSEAADLLFGEGKNEVTYTWDIGTFTDRSRNAIDADGRVTYDLAKFRCEGKARADRITSAGLIDLKTATSASPSAFERAMDRDGHHVRAAWYLDGFNHALAQPPMPIVTLARPADYIFVVVAKAPPHLVSIYSTGEVPDRPGWFHISGESIDKGRLLYKKALAEFRRAWEADAWPVYSGKGENKRKVSLPAYRLNQIYAQERAGEFDDQDSDIPY